MTESVDVIRLLKHYLKQIESNAKRDDSLRMSIELEKVETTQDGDPVRSFATGKGRKLTIEWREK